MVREVYAWSTEAQAKSSAGGPDGSLPGRRRRDRDPQAPSSLHSGAGKACRRVGLVVAGTENHLRHSDSNCSSGQLGRPRRCGHYSDTLEFGLRGTLEADVREHSGYQRGSLKLVGGRRGACLYCSVVATSMFFKFKCFSLLSLLSAKQLALLIVLITLSYGLS